MPPPPYPRPGTTKVMENDLVIVWDVSWLKQAYPVHRHLYDYAGIYYTDGDRIIVSEQGTRSPTHSVAWDTFFLPRGITHSEEGASEQPLRGVFLEFKQPQPVGTIDARTSPPAFPGTSGKQLRDSERVTICEITAPGASSSPHRHVRRWRDRDLYGTQAARDVRESRHCGAVMCTPRAGIAPLCSR